MKNDTIRSFKSFIRQFGFQTVIENIFFSAGAIFLIFSGNLVRAQSTPPSAIGNTTPPNFDNLSPREFDNIRSPQQNWNYSSNGSQQFFRQDNDDLYFLPEDESDSILQIDEKVTTEEIEDSPSDSLNK